jgi:hypothetical protein
MSFNHHELLPYLSVVRFLASPCKVILRDIGVSGARESIVGNGFLKTVDDRFFSDFDPTKLFRLPSRMFVVRCELNVMPP